MRARRDTNLNHRICSKQWSDHAVREMACAGCQGGPAQTIKSVTNSSAANGQVHERNHFWDCFAANGNRHRLGF